MSLFSRENRNKKNRPKDIDVHSHVSFPEYDHDRGAVLDRMRYQNIKTITVGVDLESSLRAVEIANQHDGMYASVGLHPADNKKESFNVEDYAELVNNIEVVAIGECGLDYYRIKDNDKEEKKRQEKEFRAQIEFALLHDLPLMLHMRPQKGTMDAYERGLEILKEYKDTGDSLRGNVHFFVGDKRIAKEYVALGFTLSFTGVITFASDFDAVIKETPIEMILTETDSPYATPVPNRGKRNEPVYVSAVVSRIAELKGMTKDEAAPILVENAYRVFEIPD